MAVVSLGAEQVREAVPMADAVAAVRQGFVDLAAGHFEMPTRTALRDGQLLDMACHHRPVGHGRLQAAEPQLRRPAARDPRLGGVERRRGQRPARRRRHRGDHDPHRCGVGRRDRPAGAGGRPAAGRHRHRRAGRRPGPRGPRRTTSRAAGARRPRPRPRRRPGRRGSPTSSRVSTSTRRPTWSRRSATAEIVCCSTTATEPLFALDALPAQVHVNAIGSYRPTMRELPDALLGDGLVVVDERGAILEEAGEVRHALDAGVLGVDDLLELGVALTDGVARDPAHHLQVGRRRDAGLGDRPAARRRVPRLTPGRGAAVRGVRGSLRSSQPVHRVRGSLRSHLNLRCHRRRIGG